MSYSVRAYEKGSPNFVWMRLGLTSPPYALLLEALFSRQAYLVTVDLKETWPS